MSGQADSTGLSLRADQARPWLVRAAGLSAGAGVIHLMVTPEHIDHWIGYGLFFLVAAAAQLGYSAMLAETKTGDANSDPTVGLPIPIPAGTTAIIVDTGKRILGERNPK